MAKVKPLVYPYTYEEWLAHQSTKPKLKWCKETGATIDAQKKYGTQLTIKL
jgi:hypothetical protein